MNGSVRNVGEACMVLRVFSGPHMGAEIALPAGVFVLGSDESCDIILSGLAARHFQLLVHAPSPENGGTAQVSYQVLDGALSLPGRSAADGVAAEGTADAPAPAPEGSVPPEGPVPGDGTPFLAGNTLLAWTEPGNERESWDRALESIRTARTAASGETARQVAEASTASADEAADNAASVTPTTEPGTANNVALSPDAPAALPWFRSPAKVARALVLLLVALCLTPLIISFGQDAPSPGQRAAFVAKTFEDAGFSGLDVIALEKGVAVSGTLRSDAERQELTALARNMQFPLYLDISIWQDRKNAVATALNSRGFHLDVGDSGEEGKKGGSLRIAGYVQDRLVEEWLFSSAREDVPELAFGGQNAVRRQIRHQDEVAPVLERALYDEGLDFAQLRYLPGSIEVTAVLDGQQKERLQAAVAAAEKALGIPLETRLAPLAPPPSVENGQTAASGTPQAAGGSAAAPARETGRAGFTVKEVSMKPIPYVRLNSGELVFEGGMLPGGYTLMTIGTKELMIRKDGQESVHALRGEQ